MSCQDETRFNRGLKYATSFDEKLLGVGCDVEVTIDVESGESSAIIAMRQFLRSSPVFRISIENLASVAAAINSAKASASLLQNMVDGGMDHQLYYSVGGASLIVVQPKDRKARFVLAIGAFSREGDLDSLSDADVTGAVQKVDALKAKVRAKVMASKTR